MRFTWKDTLAAVLVAAVVVPYLGYLIRGDMPFIQDPRGMAATGIVLGAAAALLTGRTALRRGTFVRVALVLGIAALGTGIAALWTENEFLLATFIGLMVATWALGTLIHTKVLPSARHTGATPGHT
ncbi:MAG: hypothetical protein ABIQ18_02465 [Umezawaea sp.]